MGRKLTIRTPRAFVPLLQPARYKGLYGGRGGMKSHQFAEMLLERGVMAEIRAICIREVQESLAQSVKRLLEDKIKSMGLSDYYTSTLSQIRGTNGTLIVFAGMQDHTAESIKSLEGFDIAWVEEAQSLSERSLMLLRPTIRKDGSELWFSWNPRFETDAIDRFLRSPDCPPGAIVRRVTWRDNPFLPKALREELEWDLRRDTEKYEHVWEGGYEKHSEARVFKNWKVVDFETPHNAEFLLGGDWGFSVDPCTACRCYLHDEKTLRIDAEVFKIGVEIDDTPAHFDALGCQECRPDVPCDGSGRGHAMAREWVLVMDSSEPKSISYMQRHGYPRIVGAVKGPNSIVEGVKFLKQYDIEVHPRCTHTIDELINYKYKTHPKTGDVMPILDDKKNHIIDPLRYAVEAIAGLSRDIHEWQVEIPPPAYQHLPSQLTVEKESGLSGFNLGQINGVFGQ